MQAYLNRAPLRNVLRAHIIRLTNLIKRFIIGVIILIRDRNMSRARTIHNSDWKDGFLFVGNQLALDFLNTRPVQNGEPMELLPDFSALLRWFQAAELLSARDAANLQQKWGESTRAPRTRGSHA